MGPLAHFNGGSPFMELGEKAGLNVFDTLAEFRLHLIDALTKPIDPAVQSDFDLADPLTQSSLECSEIDSQVFVHPLYRTAKMRGTAGEITLVTYALPRNMVWRLPAWGRARQCSTFTWNPARASSLSKAGLAAADQKATHPPGLRAARAACNPA